MKRAHEFNDGWQFFVCYLIDQCEGETVSEEMLQRTIAAFLCDHKYSRPELTPSDLTLARSIAGEDRDQLQRGMDERQEQR